MNRCDIETRTYDMWEETTTACDNEMVTLAVAAKALGVTRRTVERYMRAGKLTKMKNSGKSSVRMSDVRRMRAEMNGKSSDRERDVGEHEITMPLSRFEALISENGALKHQAEFLLEDLTLKEAREKDLDDARRKIVEQERLVGRLEGQLEALKPRVSWWRRIFPKNQDHPSDS
jgi:hypothetical protein